MIYLEGVAATSAAAVSLALPTESHASVLTETQPNHTDLVSDSDSDDVVCTGAQPGNSYAGRKRSASLNRSTGASTGSDSPHPSRGPRLLHYEPSG